VSASSSFLRFIRSLRASASRRAIWMRCWMVSAFMSAIIIVMTGAREAGEAVGLGTNGREVVRRSSETETDRVRSWKRRRWLGWGRGDGASKTVVEGVRQAGTSRRAPSDSGPSRLNAAPTTAMGRGELGNELQHCGEESRAEQSRAAEEKIIDCWFSERRTERLGPERYMLQVQTHSVLGFGYRIHAEPGAASQSPIPRSRPRGRTDRYHPGGWLAQGTTAKQRRRTCTCGTLIRSDMGVYAMHKPSLLQVPLKVDEICFPPSFLPSKKLFDALQTCRKAESTKGWASRPELPLALRPSTALNCSRLTDRRLI
jgi:hypothetical protein